VAIFPGASSIISVLEFDSKPSTWYHHIKSSKANYKLINNENFSWRTMGGSSLIEPMKIT